MHRFYVPLKIFTGQVDISDVEQLHHLRDVLRLTPGDQAMVFDPSGKEYRVEIAEINKQKATLLVKYERPLRIKKLRVGIACAIPKMSGMDDVIDKLTQLDVDTIIPLLTERVVVRPANKEDTRLQRWRKIALNAAEQSQRNTLPEITPVMDFKAMLPAVEGYQGKLIPTLDGGCKPLKDILAGLTSGSVFAAIGPEGDFTPEEIDRAISSGFTPVSLGDTTLRVETAAIAVASYIKLALC
jgi:16S rRNA (uracil1498-N3)-methyltransferase